MRAGGLRAELKRKVVKWLISFHRLDPRYKILTFFNEVARVGADGFCNEDDSERDAAPSTATRSESLLQVAFDTASILTVWRPCSNDAMRKMMEGTGVGKGLDIKGKSAKRGELSALVPFLQIHFEEHKRRIQEISCRARLRLYLTSEDARAQVRDLLAPLGNDDTVVDPARVVYGDMVELDGFAARGFWGLEMGQRLFWKGLVEDAAIERDAATETGRPSMPAFQDANLATLKAATERQPTPSPMPVVLQHSRDNPLSPLHLLMAYEENDTVSPVVSDFDGFLLGWRREALWFGCQLPHDQVDLMVWAVDQIEKVLDDRTTAKRASKGGWTPTWLDVLKLNSDVHPKSPQYGFGDPKSYGIMERAALRLLDTGAVRHGAECFNYYNPQEIDETFLVVSDTLHPVPWAYVSVTELQHILSQRIQDGFVFPLNPKWILCDPGWKALYDRLMASEALYAEYARDVWYPPSSGVREKIERICKKHPEGFIPESNNVASLRQSLRRQNPARSVHQNVLGDAVPSLRQPFGGRQRAFGRQGAQRQLSSPPSGGELSDGESSDDGPLMQAMGQQRSFCKQPSLDEPFAGVTSGRLYDSSNYLHH